MILIYIEIKEHKVHPIVYQMLGVADQLCKNKDIDVLGVVVGSSSDINLAKEQLLGLRFKEIHGYATSDYFKLDLHEHCVSECIKELNPSVFLIGATPAGRSLAPTIAVKFKTGVTADCTQLDLTCEGELLQTRPAFGGNVMAQIVTPNSRPQISTVRYNVMKPAEKNCDREIKLIKHNVGDFVSSLEIIKIDYKNKMEDITTSNILVVAGNGIKKKDDLAMIYALSEALGGQVAATKAIVQNGWIDASKQIGLSGHSVSPKLIITCGVSGSVQFIAGMQNSKKIVAINSDPNAKIFNVAHYPILSDIYSLVPKLTETIKQGNSYYQEIIKFK